jgi:hypothetical protein
MIDDEEQTTTEDHLTATQILTNAGLNPGQYYLVLIRGQNQVSYQEKGDEQIHIHPNLKFISVFIGATPVS